MACLKRQDVYSGQILLQQQLANQEVDGLLHILYLSSG